jgi:hypothetical protein
MSSREKLNTISEARVNCVEKAPEYPGLFLQVPKQESLKRVSRAGRSRFMESLSRKEAVSAPLLENYRFSEF